MAEKPQEPRDEQAPPPQSANPVEPAVGAREPGQDANAPRPPHPTAPAEGER